MKNEWKSVEHVFHHIFKGIVFLFKLERFSNILFNRFWWQSLVIPLEWSTINNYNGFKNVKNGVKRCESLDVISWYPAPAYNHRVITNLSDLKVMICSDIYWYDGSDESLSGQNMLDFWWFWCQTISWFLITKYFQKPFRHLFDYLFT